ncbi:MAG: hypothetical protein AB1778_04725 [Candidatus Bipolaricaulota bacterium]
MASLTERLKDLVRPFYWTLLDRLTAGARDPLREMLRAAMEFERFNEVGGDYLEFGVMTGVTFATAYHMARSLGLSRMRFFAFDSFYGVIIRLRA